MTRRLMPICAALLTSTLLASAAVRSDHDSSLTVHEWGTFTAVAGQDGRPVQWMALSGPNDLPCFVRRAADLPEKSRLWATVRMETPVLYFYAPAETKVDVNVRVPLGLMTEYFPPAEASAGPASASRPAAPLTFPMKRDPAITTWRAIRPPRRCRLALTASDSCSIEESAHSNCPFPRRSTPAPTSR